MNFNKIDMDNWNRKQHFEHYSKNVKCGFSITSNYRVYGISASGKGQIIKALSRLALYGVNAGFNLTQSPVEK